MKNSLTGTLIKGYEVRDLIGEGSFGAVYKAYQTVIDRVVAIKIIYPELANYPEFIRRFDTEARTIASLEHPQIVPIYDYWRDPSGAYLIMRWIRGGSLRHWLNEGEKWQGRQIQEVRPIEKIVHIIGQVASATAMTHRFGVIHRDIKPENILIDDEGNAYLSDFGIALMFGGEREQLSLVGSPAYAAPEQLRDEQSIPQSDQYSLAIIAFELLTGQHPFAELLKDSIDQLVSAKLELPALHTIRPDLPSQLDAVLQQATAFDPKERFPDMKAFAKAFREALTFRTQQQAELLYFQGQDILRTPNGTLRHPDGSPVVDQLLTPLPGLDVIPNPYQGLRAFDEADSKRFFGREQLTEHLLNRVAEKGEFARFLAVVGPSGSGKSSLVKAGLIPALRDGRLAGSQNWFIVSITPSTNPKLELRNALLSIATDTDASLSILSNNQKDGLHKAVLSILPDDDSEFLLVIDQFEELFTHQEDEKRTAFFLENLYYAVVHPQSRFRLIISLRADFYDRPLMYENFSMLMRNRTDIVVPMRAEDLERAIVEPARIAGVVYEPAVIAEIIAEVSGELGALPLLQYGLTELYKQRDTERNTITLDSYKALGGILGALAQQAEATYITLEAPQQQLAQQIFLRLVNLGEGTEDTRRRVSLEEILALASDRQDVQVAIDQFGTARLLTFDRDPATRRPTVEVAHEAILREWTRLRSWLDDSRNDVRQQRVLSSLATDWVKADRDTSYLLTGVRLQQFESWQQETRITLNVTEKAYMQASLEARERRKAQEAEQKAQRELLERRARDRLRLLVGILFLATVGALILSGFAFSERENARQSQERALSAQATSDANAERSQSSALVANAQAALSGGDPDRSLTLAIQATQFEHAAPDAEAFLVGRALAPGTRLVLEGHTDDVRAVTFASNDTQLITGSADGVIYIWDAETGELQATLEGHRAAVRGMELGPDGTSLLSTAEDGTVRLWNIADGTLIHTIKSDSNALYGVAFSENDARIAAGAVDGMVYVWDRHNYELLQTLETHTEIVRDVDFDPSGTYLASVGDDSKVIIWDLESGESLHVLEDHSGDIWFSVFSPDGMHLLTGADDAIAMIWDVESGEAVTLLRGHTRIIHGGVFSPDGRTILTASGDGTVIEWDVASGSVLRRFSTTNASAAAIAVSTDGSQALVGYGDNTARLWELSSPTEVWRYAAGDFGLLTIALDEARDIAIIAPTARDIFDFTPRLARLVVIDLDTGHVLREILVSESDLITDIALSPDGNTLVSGLISGAIIVWDTATWEQRYVLEEGIIFPTRIAINSDGEQVLTGTFAGNLLLWNLSDGEVVQRLAGHSEAILDVAFSPDGLTAASGGQDDMILFWDIATGEMINQIEQPNGDVFSVAYSSDGERLLTAASDFLVTLWDTATGNPIRVFEGHTASAITAAFSTDETLIASGGDDRQLIIWDSSSGERLYTFEGHTGVLSYVTFGGNSSVIYSAAMDGTLRRWEVPDADFTNNIVDWISVHRYVPNNCEGDNC